MRQRSACIALCALLWSARPPVAEAARAKPHASNKASAAATANWPAHLRKYGITPLTPPAPAPDFTLPDLQGRETRLQRLRGDWVLLTFFATWCGPCASEMPSLQALYEQRKSAVGGNKVHILGIATDPEGDVQGFVRARGMGFGVLLDTRGEAGRMYQASSIPMSFLIDPGGQVVGMTRGARDWRRMGSMFDELPSGALTALEGASDGAAGQPTAGAATDMAAADTAPVALPPDVMPPQATARVRGTPAIDMPFVMDVEVTWTGKSSDYILLPPEVHTPEGVEVLSVAAHTGSAAGAARIDYEIKLVARKTGAFALDPVDIRYTPAGSSEPLATRLLGPTVHVDYTGLRGLWAHHSRALMASVAAVCAVGGAAIGGRMWQRKRRADRVSAHTADTGTGTERWARAQEQLKTVQQLRLSGNVPAFLHQLLSIEPELDPPSHRKTLEALAEAATYGNMRPDDEVLNQLERQAVRKVRGLAPDIAKDQS